MGDVNRYLTGVFEDEINSSINAWYYLLSSRCVEGSRYKLEPVDSIVCFKQIWMLELIQRLRDRFSRYADGYVTVCVVLQFGKAVVSGICPLTRRLRDLPLNSCSRWRRPKLQRSETHFPQQGIPSSCRVQTFVY